MNNETSHAALQPSKGEQPKKANRRWRRLGLWALGIVGVGALITWLVLKPLAWTEDVLLSDGTVVEIKQRVHGIQSYGEIGGPGGWYADHYEIAANEKLGIKTPWIGRYGEPLVFDRSSDGYWFVISTFQDCDSLARYTRDRIGGEGIDVLTSAEKNVARDYLSRGWKSAGLFESEKKYSPSSPYIEHRYIDGVWKIHELEKIRNQHPANLLLGPSRVSEQSHYTLDSKRSRRQSHRQAPYIRNIDIYQKSSC